MVNLKLVIPANSGRVGALVFSLTFNELAQGKLFIKVSAVVGTAWLAVVAASCQASQSCLTGPESSISIWIIYPLKICGSGYEIISKKVDMTQC